MAEEQVPKKKIFSLGVIANIVAILLGFITLTTIISARIDYISLGQTRMIVSAMADDLRIRLNLYESFVAELRGKGKEVPILLIYNIKSLEDQLDDLKDWDINHED